MVAGGAGDLAAAFGAADETDLEEVRLDDVFERIAFFAEGGGDGLDARRPAVIDLDQRPHERPVQVVQSQRVDAFHRQGAVDDVAGQSPRALDLGIVADALEQAVGDTRRAARPRGDHLQRAAVEVQFQQPGRAAEDVGQLGHRVKFKVVEHPEPAAEGRAEQPGPRGRPDQRKPLERKVDRLGVHAAVDGKVNLEIFHRRVDELLDRGAEPVDLVDEQDIARADVAQQAHYVALFGQGRAGADADGGVHLVGDDVGQRRLAQAGRAVKEDVIQRLAALPGGRNGDRQLLLDVGLPDALGQAFGPEGVIKHLFFVAPTVCTQYAIYSHNFLDTD